YWDEVFRRIGAEYPLVSATLMHADALAAKLVLEPEAFDVIVASNLLGDLLSEVGAAVQGGIGMAASANLNPDGGVPNMYEPGHGSQPGDWPGDRLDAGGARRPGRHQLPRPRDSPRSARRFRDRRRRRARRRWVDRGDRSTIRGGGQGIRSA